MSSTDHGLITPDNCAILLVDLQREMLLSLPEVTRSDVVKQLALLARAARIFSVPVILTTVRSRNFRGAVLPEVARVFAAEEPVLRSSLNAWDDEVFVKAVRETGRKNFLIAALWSETSLVFPALEMLEEGLGVYAVADACGGISRVGHDAALRRIEQAGAVSVTALQVLLEFQRDWSCGEHAAEVSALIHEQTRRRTVDAAPPGTASRRRPMRRKPRAQA